MFINISLIYAYATEQNDAKTLPTTAAIRYKDSSANLTGVKKVGNWRLPNQRELAVLYMIDPKLIHDGTIYTRPGALGVRPRVNGVHCRTTTLNSNVPGLGIKSDYTEYGYWYNTVDKKIECAPNTIEILGIKVKISAAYFCVRDYVPN